MSTFGKILAFFNLIFAVVFVVVAGMDYGKQQSWSYSEFRHREAIIGLPVSGDDIDELEPDHKYPIADRLSPGVLAQMFEGHDGGAKDLGGPPVKTLFEEVDRVRAKVRSNVTAEANNPQRQKQMLKYYLLGLAKTLGERIELTAIADADVEKGLAEIDKRFNESKTNATLGPANKKELRARIAHVLVNVNPAPEWRKRVMVVVGLEALIDALNNQANGFARMVADLHELIAIDQSAFERLHADLVLVILKESDDLHKANEFLKDLKNTAAVRQQQVMLRQTEKNNYDTRLVQARADTTKEIARLNGIQKDLFDLQQKLGLAMKRNQDLEAELGKLEQNSKR